MANTKQCIACVLAENEGVLDAHLCGSECCAPEWEREDQAVHMRNAYYKAAEEITEFSQ